MILESEKIAQENGNSLLVIILLGKTFFRRNRKKSL